MIRLIRFSLVIFACLYILNMATGTHTVRAEEPGNSSRSEKALFAGGCFWCMEPPFEKLEGVLSVVSGYAGGRSVDPNYKNYASGGHIEVVLIEYDSQQVSYQELLDVFWRQVDPTDSGGQFVDRGHEYSTAVFYFNEEQKVQAVASRDLLEAQKKFSRQIVTPILPATTFYKAEEYHQDYYRKNPVRYRYYRYGSGRDRFLDKIWGKGNH